jgi:dTDP-4-dehydrorhamnose 3,5-epimerase
MEPLGIPGAWAVTPRIHTDATVLYLCSTQYVPSREHGVDPLDPELGIAWPADLEPVLSAKDAAAPSLAKARAAGLLPDYAECLAYAASLQQRPAADRES